MELFKWFSFNLLLASVFFPLVFGADVFSEALISFKAELLDPTDSLNDWFLHSSEANPSEKIQACSWSGVTCNSNSTIVTGLDLSKKHLSGEITGELLGVFLDLIDLNLSHNSFSGQLPVSIFNLVNLRTLDISRNSFSGHFPNGSFGLKSLVVLDAFSNSFSGQLPAELSQIESLRVLNLAGSYFSGQIPSEFGSFKSLEFVHLAGNFLNGSIPPELGKLKTLTHMEIGYNSYQGGIPWQLGNMSELQYLDIAGANLSGPIPIQLSNLTKLESLFLFRNQLNGPISSEFSKLVPLRDLDLSDNQIYGQIPESFAELKNLRLLSLMCNDMSGTIPQGIAELPMLETLLIWSNSFSGSLPDTLGSNTKLKLVDVSTNNLNGSIPNSICFGGVLSKLIIFSNNFSGELPSSLSNCFSLVRLRVEDNSISGNIPLKFSRLRNISYIDLSRNKFTGGIPDDISQAPTLEYFNVSHNPELGGNIPPNLWSLPLLKNFSASSCNILGNFPSFQSCESVSVIELNANNLSETIPESISDCQALEMINLSNNSLTGPIPEGLSTLPSLKVIDLSHNKLNGLIPAKFGNSSSLRLLNVSFNDLSGSIPQEKSFRLMGNSSFEGNPKLCGVPLQPCREPKEIRDEFTWALILCAVVVVFIALAVSGLFYFQKVRKDQWKMVSFSGLPQFTPNDVLKSLHLTEGEDTIPSPSSPICKALLPTGLTVLVKIIEWEPHKMRIMMDFIAQMGNARHKNLIRLLGLCYNNHLAYLLYDLLPQGNLIEKLKVKRDWASKYRLVIGIARGLKFLHHDCYPAIPHGDVRSSNIVVDENMEPQLAELGFKFLVQVKKWSFLSELPGKQTGEMNAAIQEEIYGDIYKFGEVILEILSNGRMRSSGKSMQSKPKEVLFEEICSENEVGCLKSLRKEMKLVLEVAFLCTRSKPSDRPSMEDALKILSGLKQLRS
ncbi:hypothetical protein Nepgr_006320 [Nepenthes gracilis]|uniref:Protein kinase domain-containing protein n=1 Tax=Nepenthes gracilis TaxID=150966 RepID=A0AAD3S4Z4_NEPGR|nr:hypothetical protein Nepgr_006320 [Nepenthes gracilis]